MRPKDISALIGTAIVLISAAGITQAYQLWSFLANYTVPWFCDALAISLLLVVLTAVLAGTSAADIPISRVLVVIAGSSIVVGVGMLLDSVSYTILPDWTASIGEWLGFTIMLIVVFWIPRTKWAYKSKQVDAGDSE